MIGRRNEYQESDLRRSLIKAKERDDFKIITYDSLIEALDLKYPLFVGARSNKGVEILSNSLVGSSLFSWVSPDHIGVSSELLTEIRAHRPCHFVSVPNGEGYEDVFRVVEDKLRIRK